MADVKEYSGGLAEIEVDASSNEERFRNFTAIQDVPPQKTLFLHVNGEVLVGNPGVDVELTYAIPQGINPNILLLTANFLQRPGMWIQKMTWKPTSYTSGMIQYNQYSEVQIVAPHGGITVPVTDRA